MGLGRIAFVFFSKVRVSEVNASSPRNVRNIILYSIFV